MCSLDKIKGEARREAWKDDMNPWGRSRLRSLPPDEEANRVPSNGPSSLFKSLTKSKSRPQDHGQTTPITHAETTSSSTGKAKGHAEQDIPGSTLAASSQQTSEDMEKGVNEPVLETTEGLPDEPAQPRRRRNRILHPFSKDKAPTRPGIEEQRRTSSFFKKDEHNYTLMSQIRATLFNSWINVLLIFVPAGIALHYAHVKPVAVFVVNFVAIIPLAAMLSYATEEIAMRVGETFGGLLNATFG